MQAFRLHSIPISHVVAILGLVIYVGAAKPCQCFSAGLKASPKDEVNLFEFVKIENYGKKLNPIVFLSTSLLYPVLYTLPYAGHFCTAAPLAIFLIARAPVFPRPFLLPRALPPTWERRCHALGGTAAAGRATPLAPFACER